jgi:MFS family permease
MPAHGTRRLVCALYAYAFLDEFVLLYPLYALLFTDAGLTAGQVSALFVLWSATGIVLEVPSGALADAVSRRALLVVAPLVGAVGYALWVTAPSFWAFAAGFVLWGVRGALVSGSLEALVYTELDARGAAGDYARVLGRSHTAGVLAVVLATALAAPAFGAGGYRLLGAVSVAAGLLASGAALLLPEQRRQGRREGQREGLQEGPRAGTDPRPDDPGDADEPGYLAILSEGLRESRSAPAVRRAVLLVPAVTALWGSLEEYTSLLVRGTGVPTGQVPWWELVLWGGAGLGGLLAGRAAGLSAPALGSLVAAGGMLLAVGAASGVTAGVVAVAAGFAALQLSGVVVGAWLQDAVTGPARATVTSVASLAAELVAVAVYVVYGALAGPLGPARTFALLGLVYLPVAAWVARGPGRVGRGEGRGRTASPVHQAAPSGPPASPAGG